MSPRKYHPDTKKTNLMSKVSKLKRNDVEGALAVYKKMQELIDANDLADDPADISECLVMLQDRPDEYLARVGAFNAERSRAARGKR